MPPVWFRLRGIGQHYRERRSDTKPMKEEQMNRILINNPTLCQCRFTEGDLAGCKGIHFPVPLVILMLCLTQHIAIAQQPQIANSVGGATTDAGVPLPTGWTLQQSDMFGTDGNVTNYTQLHAKYCEGQFYNVDSSGCLVQLPNVVINDEQELTSISNIDRIFHQPLDDPGSRPAERCHPVSRDGCQVHAAELLHRGSLSDPRYARIVAGLLVRFFNQSEFGLRDRRGTAGIPEWG